ncbi:hypothetical protein C2S51_013067 [Perilla frutescens var. frutescens]|nr:hypothetical protein C2S51_013067 [Perilla frutescens var. frutescens]
MDMNMDWRKQRSDNVSVMKSRLFDGPAKERLNQEITCQFSPASSSHESVLPISRATVGFGVSPCSFDPNLSYSGFNSPMASNSGSGMLRFNDKYNSRYFQKSSQDDHRGSTVLVDSYGKGMPSLEDLKQLYGEVVSPEQISSVTTCSDAECYSDKVRFEVGALGAFSEPTSGDNTELDKFKAWLPDPISLLVQEDTSPLSSMPFNKPKLRPEQSPHYGLQALQLEHCRLQSCPPAHVEISLATQMYGSGVEHLKLHNEVPVERSSKLSQLSLERLLRFERKGFSNAQAPRPTDSTRFLQNILVAYLNFKSKLAGLERRPQEFVNHLHLTVCKVQTCECEKYHTVVSHFDNCHNTDCNLCQPVRQLCYTKKISSGLNFEPCPIKKIVSESGKPKGYGSRDVHSRDCIVQDMQPTPKRMKIENAAKFDDWSLFAVILPHRVGGLVCDEDYTEKTNNEPFSTKEMSTTAVTGNATADNGESLWSRKSDGHLGLEQSPEGHMNSASLNEVPRSIGNLGSSLQTFNDALGLDNLKLGKDDFISLSKEFNSVDEQQDMGWIKTSKVKSDVTSGCQSSNSDGIYVLPQVGNIGKSLQTSSDALDLDNIKLGKDVTISHSVEHNLVDEKQEIGCVETSKVKSDVTFGCQNLNSGDISVLPVGDLGKCLQTFNDALDLDEINLGKDESLNFDGISVLPQESPIDEGENFKIISQAVHDRIDAKYDLANTDNQCGRTLDDLKVSGVSLTDFFTAEQIRDHLRSLNEDINLNVEQELQTSMSAQTVGSNTCQLCALDGIMFTALAMCCTSCGARIKHKLTYYWTKDEAGAQYCFCTTCFKEARGGNISCRGLSFPKAQLYKGKNTEESGEAWVQCDKCERWQHQICALYNSERDLKGKAKYTCPFCRLAQIEAKGHVSITPASGAQDLPRTKLSDYIEQRLFRSLEKERKQRAEFLGKNLEEVPGVSDLIVRVVFSVNKQLRVKQQFLDILHGETYPTEFPYKSKVVLLFQKVEGVDVCLFAMYVQEFGSECGNPNKRSVYISYLDSVKYFRPELKTVTGVALRTFIGYLDYCKRLGFLACYIWSCPPLRGEDYILHCHPETQKRPNPNKLVQWYKKMLRKAKEENVVVDFTNFYDYFFVPNGDSRCKITAARLPYFDGDYWSCAIEDMVQTIEKDSGGESDRQLKNQMTKRTMKAMGHNELSTDATKDILVMQKLGHKILPVKDEFFVVHLQFTCTHCREAILSGSCWACNQCSKFHLCGRCLEFEQSSNLLETHTGIFGDKHQLHQIPVNDVAADTDDKDGLLENDFFGDRHSFLNFCEKNYYRFDTLRRAKHSSMMIVHHLHASRETAMKTICRICNQNVVVEWHCAICSQFHVCNACYQREGDGCHVHKLINHLKKADSGEKSEQVPQQRASEADSGKKSGHMQQQLRASEHKKLLELVQHANECQSTRDNPCSYPNCCNIRKSFRHTRECERRATGGCNVCNKIWYTLHLHSHNCKDYNCNIPRCMDIKNYRRKRASRSGVNNLNNHR